MGISSAWRRGAFLLPVLVAIAAAVVPLRGAHAQGDEFAIKAAFLYKFGDYVEWPPAAFEAPTAPVNLCVVGDDPFGPVLDRTVSGEKIAGRPIAVQRIAVAEKGMRCHILYIAGSARQSVAQALEAVQGTPVLTVTDSARAGGVGIVHFVRQGNRVRFEIDDDAAEENALAISSKLFPLASAVKSRK